MTSENEAGERYVRDIAYRSHFVATQAPVLLSYVAAGAGCAPPDPAGPFSYIELGCGSGVTLNGLAAACPQGRFTGVDFNGESIAAARAAAAAAGLDNVSYLQAGFSALDVAALPQADYVACTGTWSWLDDVQKDALVNVVRGALRDGGLLYLGYVSLGRSAVTPMWQVLRALVPDAGQGSAARLTAGIALLGALRDAGARYPQQNPSALALLDEVQAQCAAGEAAALDNLSHNLLADGFRAELLDEVAARLAPAGLEFCGGAAPYANDPDLAVPAGLRARHDALPTRLGQELFKDFLNATLARADVFVRRPRRDPGAAQRYLAGRSLATLTGPPAELQRQLARPGWTSFSFDRPVIQHVFDRLAAGLAGVEEIAAGAPFAGAEVRDAFAKLVASPGIELCVTRPGRPDAGLPARVRPASGYNRVALEAASGGAVTVQLAAPVLGSCVPVTLPGSLVLAQLCDSGLAAPAADLHAGVMARAAALSGVDPAALRQLADPAFFAQLLQAVSGGLLPMLLRVGAITAA